MDGHNNNLNNQPDQNSKPQRQSNTPNGNAPNSSVSRGEMFVATNLLSKIGVLFVIASVIAFSAVSEGYLAAGVRMALVISVGVVMLGVGALFFKKGSVMFANALIYGGTAELFICSLIGYHGFEVWGSYGSLFMGIIAAVVGIGMSQFTKSQGLLIVTAVFSVLPVFVDVTVGFVGFAAAYFMAMHCFVAVISRKKYYTAAMIIGAVMALVEIFCVGAMSAEAFDASEETAIFSLIFVICCGVIYSSAPLLNALDNDGDTENGDTVLLIIVQAVVIFCTHVFLQMEFDSTVAGVALGVLVVIYAVIAAGYGLKFWSRCKTVTVFINLILATLAWGVTFIVENDVARYIIMHVLAAGVLIAGVVRERDLFRNWGYSLLGFSELLFLVTLVTDDSVPAIIINLVLWFGLLAFFIIRKQTDSALFRVYSCLAFLNAGILGAYLITEHFTEALKDLELWANGAGKAAFSGLLCATLWMLLGFAVGKLKYLRVWGSVSSFMFYGIGFMCLGWANLANTFTRMSENALGAVMIAVTVIVNVVSVLSVLDITLQIEGMAPKFAKAVGLIVSAYALMSLTTILGTNDFVKFTSCIISIIYIIAAIFWIVIGFRKLNALLRRFGLALVLMASAKLFLFDFIGIDPMGRTLLFIGFGVTLLVISFGYGIAEKKLKDRENKS